VADILWYLDNSTVPPMPANVTTTSITLPNFTMNFREINDVIADMDCPQFWLQQGLKNEALGLQRLEHANVFYRQGLRITPDNLKLIYNLARNSVCLNKYEAANKWFDFGL